MVNFKIRTPSFRWKKMRKKYVKFFRQSRMEFFLGSIFFPFKLPLIKEWHSKQYRFFLSISSPYPFSDTISCKVFYYLLAFRENLVSSRLLLPHSASAQRAFCRAVNTQNMLTKVILSLHFMMACFYNKLIAPLSSHGFTCFKELTSQKNWKILLGRYFRYKDLESFLEWPIENPFKKSKQVKGNNNSENLLNGIL